MATEYQLSYTAAEIDEKLGKVDENATNISQLSETIDDLKQNTTCGGTSISLKNLKCGVLGDSITFGSYVDRETESYPSLLKAEFGEVINYGQSGTLISKTEGKTNSFCERYSNMADDLDVIIVMGGVNDFVNNSKEGSFGEPTSTDETTFYGALNTLMLGLSEKYMGKEIFFCTPMHINYNGITSDTVRQNGKTFHDYRNAIIERCSAHSITCIDIFATSGMDIVYSDALKNYFTVDGCHPNATGHKRLHDRILHEVISKIGYKTISNEEPEQITLESISVVFSQGDTVIYTDTALNSLKNMLTVKANYSNGTSSNVTDYTLSGTLVVGTSVITVSYSGKTATFNVNVSQKPVATLESISSVYSQNNKEIYTNDELGSLKEDLTVTANYSDGTSVIINDYELSGNLTVGTSVITVSYGGKTSTFTVNVTEEPNEPEEPTDNNIIAQLLASNNYEYGYIQNADGAFVSQPAYNSMGASPYIDVNGGDTVEGELLGGSDYNTPQVHFGCVYDENKNYITSLYALNNNQKSSAYTITLPQNARYVRLTLVTSVDTNYFRIVQE